MKKNTPAKEVKKKPTAENVQISDSSFLTFIDEKIERLIKIIQKNIKSIKKHNIIDIFSNSDLNVCTANMADLHKQIEQIKNKYPSYEENQSELISELQNCFDKLSIMMASHGSCDLADILYVVFGKDYRILPPDNASTECANRFNAKLELILKNVTYIGYKITPWKTKDPNKFTEHCVDKITESTIIAEDYSTLECFEPVSLHRSFYYSVYGIRVVIQNEKLKKTIVLSGITDNIEGEWLLNENYIKLKKNEISHYIENHLDNVDKYIIDRMVKSFYVKDYLLYSSNDIYKKYVTLMKDVEYVKLHDINAITKRFMDMDILHQRNFIMNLLIYDKEYSVHYVAYMLYDLMTVPAPSSSEKVDSDVQSLIYNSLPFTVKSFFKDAMKNTIKYSNDVLNKNDGPRVTLEQQILLLKVGDTVKDKAIAKLKEIKGRPDEQTGKAKQYLEGLIKIPFNVYKKEPVLKKIGILNAAFSELILMHDDSNIPKKEKYTAMEISQWSNLILEKTHKDLEIFAKNGIRNLNKTDIIHTLNYLNLNGANKRSSSRQELLESLDNFLFANGELNYNTILQVAKMVDISHITCKKQDLLNCIFQESKEMRGLIQDVNSELDSSIYAHKNAKTQILKVISQWINGEQNGYCFGFEGSPGIGKTSLAKRGLARTLKDENGNPRPFAFIAMGGSCNGSTLEGHSYTYVNSMWGKIVDTLMDAKCMNPIIYIDELDKVSKTEQGKEIIGILTHLIDYSQNDEFQDKYFNGVPIDLSKVLFIFSYNDPELIDRILLDRIHRIKFDNLSNKDKVVIANQFILPEINKKVGFCNTVQINDELIEYIIETYTLEPGIRKLKELLYDLYGEINIELLNGNADVSEMIHLPITLKKEDLGKKYLKTYRKISDKKAHKESKVGVINGLWANSAGTGGIIPIESMFFPSPTFLELKLTGMQGDVMKESMNVAKTLAWNLTPTAIQKKWLKEMEISKNQGIHLHCPEGAISKDGPSAGTAITSVIYSLLNNKKIKNNVAITGEITLQGDVTAIGGLELKIIGGIRAGIKTFIYPKSNQSDFDEYEAKYNTTFEKRGIKFISVESITDVFPHIFEQNSPTG